MVTPSLRLTFLKGPREGDTLQYKPGSTIRVGRIVRGNEIAVKDVGISTKHLRIEPVSENWVIRDLGSSNGTLLNSDSLDPEIPVVLRHGDVIDLGEYTSISVNFVVDVVQEQKKKLPRATRNKTRQGRADLDPVGLGKRARVFNLGVNSEEEECLDVRNENKPSSRVRKGRKLGNKKLGIADEEEARNVVSSIQSSCMNSITVETEEATMVVNSKATKSKNIEIVEKSCLELVNLDKEENVARMAEEGLKEKRITRATRSKKNEIVGDSYLELEMVLNRARKRRCGKTKKKAEQKPMESFEVTPAKDEKDTDAGEKDQSCCVEEDMKNEQGTVMEVELGKMTLREWFGFLEVHWPKQINHETESMIEPMRSKTQRVCEYIAEQKSVQAKSFVC